MFRRTALCLFQVLEGLKGRQETWKGALESQALRVNVKKKKMIISSENVEKVTEEGKSLCCLQKECE